MLIDLLVDVARKVVGGLFGAVAASMFMVEAGGNRFTSYAEDRNRNTMEDSTRERIQ